MIYACVLHTSHTKGPAGKERNMILIEAIDMIFRRKAVMAHWGWGGICLALGYLLILLCSVVLVNRQIQ